MTDKIGLTIEEAADYTGIGRNTMRKLVEWEKIPVLRIGRRYIIRIDVISQPRIKNDGLCFDISDKIVVDVNIAFLVIVHGIAFADLNFLNQAHQRGTV